MERLMTIGEASRMLGCSVEWLRVAEKDSKIPRASRDLNGRRRYSLEDVNEIRRRLFPEKRMETCAMKT